MRDDGSARDGAEHCDDASDIEKQSLGDAQNISLQEDLAQNSDQAVVTVVVSKGESCNAVGANLESAGKSSELVHSSVGDVADDMFMSPKKAHLSRNASSHEECRVCQQEKDENLIDLGCQCRGGLSKAHKSCINTWFRTRGSNKCEICQQVAVNVAPPESHPAASYWVWRMDPAFRGSTIAQARGRGCFSPLWVAFSILIGGLLLDVLISIILGVSALPVNIIIGVIVVLGLGTALRLALEFCQEWSVRRVVHRVEANVHLGYHPAL